MYKIILCLLLGCGYYSMLFAQKEDYNWLLSNKLKIKFNTTPPTVTTDGGLTVAVVNTTTISDKNGDLLSYFNVNQMYSKINKVIPFPKGVGYTLINGITCVPHPTQPNVFFS